MSAYGNIRQAFADTVLEVGKIDPKLVVLVSDITHFKLQPFARACPGRYYNLGVCEQSILSMSAGMAMLGLYPVVHTITPFLIERGYEQIKDDFGYQKLPVNIITVGSSFDYAQLGTTHHSYGDFALMKTIENMQILYPSTTLEFNELFKQSYSNKMPTYTRIPGAEHAEIFPKSKIKLGKGILVRPGKKVTIVAVGVQLKTVMDALNSLLRLKINPEIIYIHTVRPLDSHMIIESVKRTKHCLVIEEHSAYGGVSDDVLRITRNMGNIRHASINIGDKFIHHYGTYEQICELLGFTLKNVVDTVKKLIEF